MCCSLLVNWQSVVTVFSPNAHQARDSLRAFLTEAESVWLSLSVGKSQVENVGTWNTSALESAVIGGRRW